MVRTFRRIPGVKKDKVRPREILVIPIHIYLEELPQDRILLRYMFPESGTVSSFLMYIGRSPSEESSVKITISNEEGGAYYTLPILKGVNRLENPISFTAQDRVILEMEGNEVGYKDIWISFLFRSQI